jgi:hypothetical protein
MNRLKLPSGKIVDLDAISMIRPPQSYSSGKTAACIIAGHPTEVSNGDADALYQAIEATVGKGDDDLLSALDDIIYRVRGALELLNDGTISARVSAADHLEAILNDYADDTDTDTEPEHGDKAGRYTNGGQS